jgi:hypothetical protein
MNVHSHMQTDRLMVKTGDVRRNTWQAVMLRQEGLLLIVGATLS